MILAKFSRWHLWIALLIGAGGLLFFGDARPVNDVVDARVAVAPPRAEASPSDAATRGSRGKTALVVATPAMPTDRQTLFPETSLGMSRRDLFAPTTWTPPPPAQASAPEQAPESGPPLPTLTFVGKKQEAGQWEVYLAQDTLTLIAHEGDTLNGDLRVDRIAPPEMKLTQLSTGRSMTLGIGDAR